MTVWVDPGLAVATVDAQSKVWVLPSQLWSWFGRGTQNVNGGRALGLPLASSSQGEEANFFILSFHDSVLAR